MLDGTWPDPLRGPSPRYTVSVSIEQSWCVFEYTTRLRHKATPQGYTTSVGASADNRGRSIKKRKLPIGPAAPEALSADAAGTARSSISFASDHVLITQTVQLPPHTEDVASAIDACMTAHDQTAARCTRQARRCSLIDISSRCAPSATQCSTPWSLRWQYSTFVRAVFGWQIEQSSLIVEQKLQHNLMLECVHACMCTYPTPHTCWSACMVQPAALSRIMYRYTRISEYCSSWV